MLHQRGEEVVIFARATSDLRHLSSTPVRVVRGGLSDRVALQEAVQHVETIFHCAACSTDWAPLQTYLEANVIGTQNLISAAQRAPRLRRFLHVSTTDIYGYPQVPCTEEHPFTDSGLPYNQTKGRAEAAVWNAHQESGIPITIIRPATIYGPRGKDFTQEIATLLRQRLMAYIDNGTAPGGFTYVDSVAQAMIDAAASPNTIGRLQYRRRHRSYLGAVCQDLRKATRRQTSLDKSFRSQRPWHSLVFLKLFKGAARTWTAPIDTACRIPAWPQSGVSHRKSKKQFWLLAEHFSRRRH